MSAAWALLAPFRTTGLSGDAGGLARKALVISFVAFQENDASIERDGIQDDREAGTPFVRVSLADAGPRPASCLCCCA